MHKFWYIHHEHGFFALLWPGSATFTSGGFPVWGKGTKIVAEYFYPLLAVTW